MKRVAVFCGSKLGKDEAYRIAAVEVATALAKRGIVGRAMPQGDILGFAPPLCLSRGEADIVVSATTEAVKEAAKTVGL
jgi:adenosylmethionine-8-amino-7-oxononanoate aminotransferase